MEPRAALGGGNLERVERPGRGGSSGWAGRGRGGSPCFARAMRNKRRTGVGGRAGFAAGTLRTGGRRFTALAAALAAGRTVGALIAALGPVLAVRRLTASLVAVRRRLARRDRWAVPAVRFRAARAARAAAAFGAAFGAAVGAAVGVVRAGSVCRTGRAARSGGLRLSIVRGGDLVTERLSQLSE